MPLEIAKPLQLDAGQAASVRVLIRRVEAEDERAPLSDQALTQIGSARVEHALATTDGRLVGYAQLSGRSLEIAADANAVESLLESFAGRPVLVWSHGRRSRLAPLLAARGFRRQRELHQLRRSSSEPIEIPDEPDGVQLRTFVVGEDEDAWLRVNANAFADHPEQGGWTRADLEAREHEAWFDPSGFLLAWHGGKLIGFHWTKIHPDGAGEVYVIGVDPSAQGTGLGAVLLLRGLAALRERGCPEVLLYVDGSNKGAMRLYERYGFHQHDLDVQWGSP